MKNRKNKKTLERGKKNEISNRFLRLGFSPRQTTAVYGRTRSYTSTYIIYNNACVLCTHRRFRAKAKTIGFNYLYTIPDPIVRSGSREESGKFMRTYLYVWASVRASNNIILYIHLCTAGNNRQRHVYVRANLGQ